MSTYHNNCI